MDPKCKVAFITGGSDGIGFAVAQELLSKKSRGVVLIGRDFTKGQRATTILNCSFGKGKAMFVKADVSDNKELLGAYEEAIKNYKGIDIVVNAAGIFDELKYVQSMHINLGGAVESSLKAYKILSKKKPGSSGIIVNICGTSGIQPSNGAPIFTSINHGIVGFSRSLGDPFNEKRTGVRVVTLCVGTTNTSLFKDAKQKCLDGNFGEKFHKDLTKSKKQNPDVCGKSVVQIVKYATSGCVYVCNDCRLYKIDMKPWKAKSKLITQFL